MKPAAVLCGLLVSIIAVACVTASLEQFVRDAATGRVVTPVGLVHPRCMAQMNHGDHIIEGSAEMPTHIVSADGEIRFLPQCAKKYPKEVSQRLPLAFSRSGSNSMEADGWQAFTSFQNPGNKSFEVFTSNMSVPSTPEHVGFSSVLFLFPGLQNYNWIPEHASPFDNVPPGFDIIQPVLQVGSSEGGFSQGWSVASWYVTVDEDVLFSALTDVKTGDVIFGNMTKIGTDTWFIGSEIMSTQKQTNVHLSKPRLQSQPWAYVTLEVYGVRSCNYYPKDTVHFTDIVLVSEDGTTVKPEWTVNKGQTVLTNCAHEATAIVKDAATVDITFQ
jgi:hypothetical protein